jgi:hypothetical protein
MDDLGNSGKDQPILAEDPPARRSGISLVCLNFKVPLAVRQQFKICAARRNMTMTELLLRILDDALLAETGVAGRNLLTKGEIKK